MNMRVGGVLLEFWRFRSEFDETLVAMYEMGNVNNAAALGAGVYASRDVPVQSPKVQVLLQRKKIELLCQRSRVYLK